ncbi:seipin-like isoform 2-T2 [Synchiropus picturatus]
MAETFRLFPGDEKGLFFIGALLVRLKDAVAMVMSRVRQVALQCVILFTILLLLLWIATFLFGSFYYTNMPLAAYITPVHYYYRTNCDSPTAYPCSYPVANISLMDNQKHVLTLGQAYRISLLLEMPDSLMNQELGMFMIRTTCFSSNGEQLSSSHSANQPQAVSTSRFSMLKYRSDLLRTIGTLLFIPAFITGISEQKQVLEVELFSDYVDNSVRKASVNLDARLCLTSPYIPPDKQYAPCVTAIIEIMSNKVQIYSSELHIHARFTGLRYWMFHFPLLSALVGISSNFVFLSLIFILNYTRMLWNVRGPSVGQTHNHPPEREVENNRSESQNHSAATQNEMLEHNEGEVDESGRTRTETSATEEGEDSSHD